MCVDAPSTKGVNDAAAANAKLAEEAFQWFTSEYDKTAPDRAAATARANAVSDAQLGAMNFATDEAKRLSQRNQTVFQPLEDQIVADAQTFDTPGRRAQAVAEATAGVENSFGRAQQANTRAMLRMGMSPTGSASAALMQDAALAKAKALAGSTAEATRTVEQQGYARKMDAAGLGKGVVGSQATQQQIATSTGGASVGASGAALGAATSGADLMKTGFGTAIQGNQSAGNLYGQAAQIQNTATGNSLDFLSSTFGSFMRSSERVKMGTGKVTDGTRELDEIEATPVHKDWQYDPSKGGPADPRKYTGAMAEDVQEHMGDEVAPGGEVIDMRAMGGKLMAGMQALSREVKQIKRQVARMGA